MSRDGVGTYRCLPVPECAGNAGTLEAVARPGSALLAGGAIAGKPAAGAPLQARHVGREQRAVAVSAVRIVGGGERVRNRFFDKNALARRKIHVGHHTAPATPAPLASQTPVRELARGAQALLPARSGISGMQDLRAQCRLDKGAAASGPTSVPSDASCRNRQASATPISASANRILYFGPSSRSRSHSPRAFCGRHG
jgi:hypothetical protein